MNFFYLRFRWFSIMCSKLHIKVYEFSNVSFENFYCNNVLFYIVHTRRISNQCFCSKSYSICGTVLFPWLHRVPPFNTSTSVLIASKVACRGFCLPAFCSVVFVGGALTEAVVVGLNF